jgi:hypothetical protein
MDDKVEEYFNAVRAPGWVRAMQAMNFEALRAELGVLPDVNAAFWSGLSFMPAYNPLGWAVLGYDHHSLVRCVLEFGADPRVPCLQDSALPVLRLMDGHEGRSILVTEFTRLIARLLVDHGAAFEGTTFEPVVLRHRACCHAVVWSFAHVMPPGARDIAFDFLKHYEELPWEHDGVKGEEVKRLKK